MVKVLFKFSIVAYVRGDKIVYAANSDQIHRNKYLFDHHGSLLLKM